MRKSQKVLLSGLLLVLTEAAYAVTKLAGTGPITINAGGTYSGNVISTSTTTPAITINTTQAVTITNTTITGKGPSLISAGPGANLTVTNTTGIAQDPDISGQLRAIFVVANTPSSLEVKNTTMTGVSFGIKVLSGTVSKLIIDNNVATSMEDRTSNGSGGLTANRPDLGHFVILNGVYAPNGADISWNQVIDTIGQNMNEDAFNLYKSWGTSAHVIELHDNYVEGLPGPTSGGFTIDGDGQSPISQWVLVDKNMVVHVANGGYGIDDGANNRVENNRVVSCGQNSDGSWMANSSAQGEVLWNFYGDSAFANNTISGQSGGLVRPNGNAAYQIADSWAYPPSVTNGNTLGPDNFTDPCIVNGAVNLAAENTERNTWAGKVAAAGQVLGDQHSTATAESQVITFSPIANQVYPSTSSLTLNATASSGLAVKYSVSGPATISGSTLTLTGPGTVTVTASQPGNGVYAAATPVSNTFTVSEGISGPITLQINGTVTLTPAAGTTITIH